MSLIEELLAPPPTTDVTVTSIIPKPDKEGRYQVFGFRAADARMRVVTFWVFRREAEEIVRSLAALGHTGEQFTAEIDLKAWAFVAGAA